MEKVNNSPKQGSSSAVLGIFAKAPVAGQVKTRLCPPLQLTQAAGLYRVALAETIQRFSGQSFDLVICYAGAEDYFSQEYPLLARQAQQGDDLGERMANALQGFLTAGYQQALVIGSDSPDLPQAQIEQAIKALQQTEVVISPARDGGYVLIGESHHQPQLFSAMPWSQDDLMAQTRRVLEHCHVPWQELSGWEDFDDVASLQRLLQRSPGSRTADYIREKLGFLVNETQGISPHEG